MTLTSTLYATTAYRSDRLTPQAPAPKGCPAGMGKIRYSTAQRLPWGHTQPALLLSLINYDTPKRLNEQEALFKERGEPIIDPFDAALNHICIRPTSLSKWSALIFFGASIGKGLTFFSSIILPLTFCVIYFGVDKISIAEVLRGLLPFIIVMLGIPILLWIICPLIMNHFPRVMTKGKGAKWELNRQTGRLTIYKEEQGQRVAYARPFYEFDAYLTRNPTPQGIIYYNLHLQHRYEALAIEGFLDSSSGNQQPVYAAWDFIQNYMDVSQPLPELGEFEMFRPYDPTTNEYDKKTKRNPRFRRDMTLEKWLDYKKTLFAQIEAINYTNRPNIMADYVDYSQLP